VIYCTLSYAIMYAYECNLLYRNHIAQSTDETHPFLSFSISTPEADGHGRAHRSQPGKNSVIKNPTGLLAAP
jgi:hypothetical protein